MAATTSTSTTTTTWQLEKYARYVLTNKGSSVGQWSDIREATKDTTLVLTLTDTKHLVITHGPVVLETHSLSTARAWMRGLCKNDSLLFLYKQSKGTRRFKVKFADAGTTTASEVCTQASRTLSSFFSIHLTTPAPPLQQPLVNGKGQDTAATSSNTFAPLSGQVSLATMVQVVLGSSDQKLPEVYKPNPSPADVSVTSVPDDVIKDYLRLFLADPSFPAFVEQVEGQLKAIMTECQD